MAVTRVQPTRTTAAQAQVGKDTSARRAELGAIKWVLGSVAAWSDRYPARKTAHLRRKAAAAPAAVQALAWAAQKRLCARYRHLLRAGKVKNQVTTAVARELVGFIWVIVCEVNGHPHATRAAI